MKLLPVDLSRYQKRAEAMLHKKCVKEIEFSRSTYQIAIKDPKEGIVWVFLHLEERDIKEGFCSCESNHSHCIHMAVAYLSIFNEKDIPLHLRFEQSIWHILCKLYEEQIGSDPTLLLHDSKNKYFYLSFEKTLFSIEPLQSDVARFLKEILFTRNSETEETSLKFSYLSPQEITLWKEGKPDPFLRYDLSYWSDLAKWFLNLQENTDYLITFKYSSKHLPNWLEADFKILKVGFYLSEAKLPLVVPALNGLRTPLKVYLDSYAENICCCYDKKKGILSFKVKQQALEEEKRITTAKESVELQDWIFIPEDGFYPKVPRQLLEYADLGGEELSRVLTVYGKSIAPLLKDTTIYLEPIRLSHTLFFDQNWNLCIKSYLFQIGDLTTGDSRLIGHWVYLDQDGFYQIDNKYFNVLSLLINEKDISQFIQEHRSWLNKQTGFQVYAKSLDYRLHYRLEPNRRLVLFESFTENPKTARSHIFNEWIYIEGQGFYPKLASSSFNSPIKPGISLSAQQIPLFISMHREELDTIPHFFSARCPVIKSILNIEVTSSSTVKITPSYEIAADYQDVPLEFFEDFIYVPEEGFAEIPSECRLPDKFHSVTELKGEELNLFLSCELEELNPSLLKIDPKLIKPKSLQLVICEIERAEQGQGWYWLKLAYQTESHQLVFVLDIKKELSRNAIFGFFEAGLISLKDARYSWIRNLNASRISSDNQKILFNTLEFVRLSAVENIAPVANGKLEDLQGVLLQELLEFKASGDPDLKGLKSTLRPYQKIGAHWLWFLYQQNLSGLLCDEMGLGKTHQAMALLVSIFNFYQLQAIKIPAPFLVVCPTSVLYHWQEKLEEFLPFIKVVPFHGKSSLSEISQETCIVLTSYGMIRNQSQLFSEVLFEVAIFDEIQVAKNPSSRIYKALSQMNIRMKLGLTGTPIENHLRDLKSLFDLILPRYLPSEKEYKELFLQPIEKQKQFKKKEILHRLITPFTLRRKKSEVLKELPEKTEEIAYCQLSAFQYQLYKDALARRGARLIRELRNEDEPVPYVHIFSLLSHLKQICNHPALYLKTPDDYGKYISGKWELFVELLREALESEQKVVVFSQYLGMLDIIENYLRDQNIGFAGIRGATRNRSAQIQMFNQDPSCKVFVASLQAGGLGIGLTGGSFVIHYDRWWNFARENQATDRVHRIGQTRGVQVFKLVTKDTFEERIAAIIDQKSQLLEDYIKTDDQSLFKTFSRAELIQLLELAEIENHLFLDAEIDLS